MEEVSVGKSALPLLLTLRRPKIPVTRVEDCCATGTEAFYALRQCSLNVR